MKIGICFGCYCPLHQGHLDVIFQAKKECDKTFVFVCGTQTNEDRGAEINIGLDKRYNIIKNFLKDDTVSVIKIDDTELGIDESGSESNWRIFVNYIYTKIENFKPEDIYWYCAEPEYEKYIRTNSKNVNVIILDKVNKISGTECRTNPIKFWNKITQPFRSYFSHNILISGTASEGKTTLVHDIGKYFSIPYSYEKARDHYNTKNDKEWNFKDFLWNITAQNEYNETLISSPQNPGIFISDSDNITTLMYAKSYANKEGFSLTNSDYDTLLSVVGSFSKTIKWNKIFLIKPSKRDLVDDGTRLMEYNDYNLRLEQFNNLCKLYETFGYTYEVLDGTFLDNFNKVQNYIKNLF